MVPTTNLIIQLYISCPILAGRDIDQWHAPVQDPRVVHCEHGLRATAGQVLLQRTDGAGEPPLLHVLAGTQRHEAEPEAGEGGAGHPRDRAPGAGRHRGRGRHWTRSQWRTGESARERDRERESRSTNQTLVKVPVRNINVLSNKCLV